MRWDAALGVSTVPWLLYFVGIGEYAVYEQESFFVFKRSAEGTSVLDVFDPDASAETKPPGGSSRMVVRMTGSRKSDFGLANRPCWGRRLGFLGLCDAKVVAVEAPSPAV